MMFKVVVLVIIVLVRTGLCQVNVWQCNGRWSQQVRCLRDGVARRARDDRQFQMPDQGQRDRIKRAVDNCFKQQGCFESPVPTIQETNARRDCFRDAKRQIDQQLNQCVDSRIRGWDPVNDYAKIDYDEWAFTVQRVFDGVRNPRDFCGDTRRAQDLRRCVERDTGYDFSRRPNRNLPNYWCDEDARCWADTTPQCQDQWDRDVQPRLCECSRRLGPDRYIAQASDTYHQCILRRVRNDYPDQDPGTDWLNEYVNSLCINKNNHPCRRQRRDYETRRG